MKEKKVTFLSVLGCLAPFALVLGIQVICSFIMTIVYSALIAAKNLGASPEELVEEIAGLAQNSEFLMTVTLVSGVISIIVFGLWYRKKRKEEEIIEKVVVKKDDIIHIAIIGVCLQLGISFILGMMSLIMPKTMESYSEHMNQIINTTSIVSIVAVVIVAPLYEELVFRGVTLVKGNRMTKFMVANIIQAALFGILHGQIVQGLYAFGMGLILGYVWYKYNNIWMPIFLHFIVNLSGVILSATTEGLTSKVADVIFTVISGLALVLLVFMVKKLTKKEVTVIRLEEDSVEVI